MTQHISDDELLDELKLRIDQHRKAFSDLQVVNRKLVELNQKLEESEALKSNFLSNIRNEINNPLSAIIGLAEQVAALSEGEEAATLAGLIAAEALQLDFQLRNIFVAAALEAGDTTPIPAQTELDPLLADLQDSFKSMADRKQVQLVTALPTGPANTPLTFCTDAEKLQVILANLLANAIEFSHPHTSVTVALTLEDGLLRIAVQDHGIGIAEGDIHRIFDRFVQLDTGARRMHPGHGLGLSIVRSLVELLGGGVKVTSVPGTGTTFTVSLPPLAEGENGLMFADGPNLFIFEPTDKP